MQEDEDNMAQYELIGPSDVKGLVFMMVGGATMYYCEKCVKVVCAEEETKEAQKHMKMHKNLD